jgi:hypothetical protein
MHFNNNTYSPALWNSMVRVNGSILGVMDHNLVDLIEAGSPNTTANGFQAFNDWDDPVGQGDGSWASASGWGSGNFLYMESNQFNGGYPNDCASGGRFVMRYNYFATPNLTVQTHASKTPAGPGRGCRGYEYYHNYIAAPASEGDAATGSKGGPL